MSSAGAGRREGPVPGPREISVPGQPEARALRRFARAEWGPLLRTVRSSLVTDKLRAIPLTLTAVCLTLAFQFVQNQAWGYQTVQNIGSVQAYEHLWVALLRTPLSLFVPALDLPVWGRWRRSWWSSGSRRSVWAGGRRWWSPTSPRSPGRCTPGSASGSAR